MTILLGSSSQLEQSAQADRRRARLARRPVPGRRGRARSSSASRSTRRTRACRRKFLDEDKTEQMGETTKRVLTVFGVVGLPGADGRLRADRHLPAPGRDRLRPAEGRRPGRRPGPARPPELRLAAARAGGRRPDRVRPLLDRRRPLPADLRSGGGGAAGDADADRQRRRRPHRRRRAAAPRAAAGGGWAAMPSTRRRAAGPTATAWRRRGTGTRLQVLVDGEAALRAMVEEVRSARLARPPDGLVPVARLRDGRGRRPAGGGARPAGRDRPPGATSACCCGRARRSRCSGRRGGRCARCVTSLRAAGPIRCALDTRERPLHCHHEKTVIVDDRVAFVGGIDWTSLAGDRRDSQRHPARAALGWHDAAVRIDGPLVADVAAHFAMRWGAVTGERLARRRPAGSGGRRRRRAVRPHAARSTCTRRSRDGSFGVLESYVRALRSAAAADLPRVPVPLVARDRRGAGRQAAAAAQRPVPARDRAALAAQGRRRRHARRAGRADRRGRAAPAACWAAACSPAGRAAPTRSTSTPRSGSSTTGG